MTKRKKDLDSELNLIAFISLLSVLICSLLLTAIWVQIGTMNVKQSIGGQAASESTKKELTLWAKLSQNGTVSINLQDVPRKARKLQRRSFSGVDGKVNAEALKDYLKQLKTIVPEARMALLQPNSDAVYEEIIALMDVLKKQGFLDLGVTPL